MPLIPAIMQFVQNRNRLIAEQKLAEEERKREWTKTLKGVPWQTANVIWERAFDESGPFRPEYVGGTVEKMPENKGMFGTETTILPGKELRTGGIEVPSGTTEKMNFAQFIADMPEGEAKDIFKETFLKIKPTETGKKDLAKTVWQRFFQINPDATTADMLAFASEYAKKSAKPDKETVNELDNLARGLFPGKRLTTLSPDERLHVARKSFEMKKMNMLAVIMALSGKEGGLGGDLFARPTKQEMKRVGKSAEQWTAKEEDELFELLSLKETGKLSKEKDKRLQELRKRRKRLKGR